MQKQHKIASHLPVFTAKKTKTYTGPKPDHPTQYCEHTPQAWPYQFRHPKA